MPQVVRIWTVFQPFCKFFWIQKCNVRRSFFKNLTCGSKPRFCGGENDERILLPPLHLGQEGPFLKKMWSVVLQPCNEAATYDLTLCLLFDGKITAVCYWAFLAAICNKLLESIEQSFPCCCISTSSSILISSHMKTTAAHQHPADPNWHPETIQGRGGELVFSDHADSPSSSVSGLFFNSAFSCLSGSARAF